MKHKKAYFEDSQTTSFPSNNLRPSFTANEAWIEEDIVPFNLNGIRYELTASAVSLIKPSTIAKAILVRNKETKEKQYFFTRSNACFASIIEYFENGILHMPVSICPLAFERELKFWGVNIDNLEACCRRKLLECKRLENDLDDFTQLFSKGLSRPKLNEGCWGRFRRKGEVVINDPESSVLAQVYFAFKLLCVVIFTLQSSFVTIKAFQEPVDENVLKAHIRSNEEAYKRLCTGEQLAKTEDHEHYKLICEIYSQEYPSSANRVGRFLPSLRHSEYFFQNTKRIGVVTPNNSQLKKIRHKDYSNDLDKLNRNTLGSKYDSFVEIPNINNVPSLAFNHSAETFERKKNEINSPLLILSNMSIKRNKRHFDDELDAIDRHVNELHEIIHRSPRNNQIKIYKSKEWLETIELLIHAIFSVEYLLEMVFAPNKIRHSLKFYSIVDLINIFSVGFLLIFRKWIRPEYKFLESPGEFLRAMASLKVLRLFTVVKHFRGFRVVLFAIRYSYKDILCVLANVAILMTVVSYFMFYIEDDKMGSIPGALWWAVITLTTVGYGDVVPQTIPGKLLGGICAISGVFLSALLVPLFINDIKIYNKLSKCTKRRNWTVVARLIEEHQTIFSRHIDMTQSSRDTEMARSLPEIQHGTRLDGKKANAKP